MKRTSRIWRQPQKLSRHQKYDDTKIKDGLKNEDLRNKGILQMKIYTAPPLRPMLYYSIGQNFAQFDKY